MKDDARQQTARRLRLAREQAGLSQGQVARKLGIHRQTVTEMEAGRRRVAAEELVSLAEIYAVRVTWLTATDDADSDPRIELAARELANLGEEDLDTILQVIKSLKKGK